LYLTRHEVIVHGIFVDLAAVCQRQCCFAEQFLHFSKCVPPDSLVVLLQLGDALKKSQYVYSYIFPSGYMSIYVRVNILHLLLVYI